MKRIGVRGLTALSNGSGPWEGVVQVRGLLGPAQLICGRATELDLEHTGRGVVAVIHVERNWCWATDHPISCETVGKMIEAMGEVLPEQLEGMGFVENTWMPQGQG